jgi:hypothetical protein
VAPLDAVARRRGHGSAIGGPDGPGTALQRQLAERDAQIRELTERNQALRPPSGFSDHGARARLVVLDQAPGPEHVRTRVRFTGSTPRATPSASPGLLLDGDEVYVDALVIKFETHS